MGLIYLITNKINGKKYIGKQLHENKKNYLGSGTVMKKAIKKYGKENFMKEILCSGIDSEETLAKTEIEYLIKYDAKNSEDFYNLIIGGQGSREYSRKDYQEEKLGKPILQYDVNGKLLKEFKSISEAEREIKTRGIWNALQNENRTAKGYRWKYKKEQFSGVNSSKFYSNKKLEVIQKDLNGNFINEYPSIRAAGRAIKGNYEAIRAVCRGERHKHRGFKWEYKKPSTPKKK